MLKESAFGKNDIRGIYGDDITEELFYYTGRGFVQFLVRETKKQPSEIWISVCRDARLHSPSLSKSLIEGIRSCGANVVDMGLIGFIHWNIINFVCHLRHKVGFRFLLRRKTDNRCRFSSV